MLAVLLRDLTAGIWPCGAVNVQMEKGHNMEELIRLVVIVWLIGSYHLWCSKSPVQFPARCFVGLFFFLYKDGTLLKEEKWIGLVSA